MRSPLFALFSLLLPCLLARADDLIKNPGFESVPVGWNLTEKTPMSTIVAEAAHRGKMGLRVTDNSAEVGSSALSERVKVKPGQKAKVTFWAKSTDKYIGVCLAFFDADNHWITDVDERLRGCGVTELTGKWVKYEFEATIPENVKEVAIWVHSWSTSTGTGDLDDFELKLR